MTIESAFLYRSFWPQTETIKKVRNAGVSQYCIFPANTRNALGQPYCQYPPLWLGPDYYDFKPLDDHVKIVTDGDENATFICMVDLNTPLWFTRMNRKPDSFCDLGRISADELWRTQTADYLQAFLNHAEKNYGDRMFAYILSCGSTSEWFDRSRGIESPSRNEAYRNWRQKQGLSQKKDIPPESERTFDPEIVVIDPHKHSTAIEYWRFVNHQNADALLYFAAKAREIVGSQKSLGAFYGYNKRTGPSLVSDGHMGYEEVYGSELMDFFVAPASYYDRKMDGGSGQVVPLGTIKRYGKTFISELDHCTHTANLTPYREEGIPELVTHKKTAWKTAEEDIAGLRREFAQCFIEKTALWMFDMWGNWYEGEGVYDAIGQCRRLWDEYSVQKENSKPTAEVALIFDPESALHSNQDNKLVECLGNELYSRIRHSGVPFEEYCFSDIEHIDCSRFKLVIFSNLFVVNDVRLALIREKLMGCNRTLLWLYAPGIITNNCYAEENVAQLCGVEYGSYGEIQFDDWKSVKVNSPLDIPAGMIRKLARDAGAHVYTDEDCVLYANSNFVAIHGNCNCQKTIALPRSYNAIADMFTGEVVARGADTVTINCKSPWTHMLHLQD